MSGLKQLRNRIKSIRATQKITKAMNVVSAARLKKEKERVRDAKHYFHASQNIIARLVKNINFLDLSQNIIFSKDLPSLFILISSERGLCGGFNSSIIRYVKNKINNKVRLILVGNKAIRALGKKYKHLIEYEYHDHKEYYEYLPFEIKDKILKLLLSKKVGSCSIFYNEFKNVISQNPAQKVIIPISPIKEGDDNNLIEYEASDSIAETMLERYITGQVNYAFAQSRVGEWSARMTAMDSATRNADELVDKLSLILNRSRQAMITTELTEIISGAEIL